MTLTTNGLNYIAKEFGIGNCFAYSGLSWTSVAIDGTTVNESGGTRNIVARLATTSMYSRIDLTYPVVKSYTYANLRTANNNTDVTIIDSQWITANDGYPAGEPQYCASVITPTPGITPTPTPGITPTPTPVYTPTPTVGPTPTPFSGTPPTFEFKGTPTGNPTVNLNLNTLVMRQAADYHFEMNDIVITNTSGWTVYVAMEVKLFTGALSSCPSVGYVFDGLDRTSTKNPRIKILEAGETATFDADFYQPTSILGVHTVCLLIRGTWLRTQLEAEILPITG
uniref:Uncharacterized protein n=1 Tax=viral metagenome TaxID=1070528 RepID=A0A6M3IIG6_9ZZZZ